MLLDHAQISMIAARKNGQEIIEMQDPPDSTKILTPNLFMHLFFFNFFFIAASFIFLIQLDPKEFNVEHTSPTQDAKPKL